MFVDNLLKDLLQLSADTQDGFWEAATNAKAECLPVLFQKFAIQWNDFGDKVFPILLREDHTSPEARWKADPHRVWMNPMQENGHMDDLAICMQCLVGLELAQTRLSQGVPIGHSKLSALIDYQVNVANQQAVAIHDYISAQDRGIA